jgi:putative ABC transport system permease protein
MMIGQITDSYVGHIEIHRRGYLAAIDSLPLNMNMGGKQMETVEKALKENGQIEAFSERVKFGAAFSNFQQTTNIRVNGVYPDREFATCPLMPSRIVQGNRDVGSLEKGKILVPELLARGLEIKLDDTVVLVATNRDGSVNGKTFTVAGILESATGPGGRDGYIHIEDAWELLRITDGEVSEVALRLKDFSSLHKVAGALAGQFSSFLNKQGMPLFDVHTWEKLSPFYNIAQMIDAMTLFVKIMLIAIVLISIMNVMIMAVYERVREIGTIAAMGTVPGRILSLFLTEGLLMGGVGAVSGGVLSGLIVMILRWSKVTFSFGRQENLLLTPVLDVWQLGSVLAIVVGVAVIASLQPAWKASRMEPIDALGHV